MILHAQNNPRLCLETRNVQQALLHPGSYEHRATQELTHANCLGRLLGQTMIPPRQQPQRAKVVIGAIEELHHCKRDWDTASHGTPTREHKRLASPVAFLEHRQSNAAASSFLATRAVGNVIWTRGGSGIRRQSCWIELENTQGTFSSLLLSHFPGQSQQGGGKETGKINPYRYYNSLVSALPCSSTPMWLRKKERKREICTLLLLPVAESRLRTDDFEQAGSKKQAYDRREMAAIPSSQEWLRRTAG